MHGNVSLRCERQVTQAPCTSVRPYVLGNLAVCLLVLPRMLSYGMFIDGVAYASISLPDTFSLLNEDMERNRNR
jgi:hypothetical protein